MYRFSVPMIGSRPTLSGSSPDMAKKRGGKG